jgi:ribosome-associated heat shock protein Hsp15
VTEVPEGGRIDVWLWRARFFRTRADASKFVSEGRIRLFRGGVESRLDKPSRAVRPGDEVIFAMSGRIRAVRIIAMGLRRGSAADARALYEPVEETDPN